MLNVQQDQCSMNEMNGSIIQCINYIDHSLTLEHCKLIIKATGGSD